VSNTNLHADVERCSPDELIPYSNNPKKHPDEQVKKIASSIKNYGWDQPIVVDGEGEIIKGHGRLQAAELLGLDEVPVIERDDLTDAEAKAARIADNKTAESEWDDELLEVEVDGLLDELDIEAGDIGFDEDEIDDILNELDDNDSDIEYTDKIETPEYEPTQDEPPDLSECFDTTRYDKLTEAIDDADVDGRLEQFLRFAAQRHIVFDYENIAEYFAHADSETQELMELLTLVIVDYDQAVEQGFVDFAEETLDGVTDA
jgi:hypothetical protein